jgi:deoxyadenosine/deoxycytidine kinase
MFSDRHPMYEKLRMLKGGIYIIEGIIGVGKTTLGNSLEYYLNSVGLKCKFYKEYFNENLLNQFIGDMKSYAYFFQMMMLVKRIEIYKEAEEFSKLGGISFIDRSLIGDMTFAKMHYINKNISEDEWKIYNNFIKDEKLLVPSSCIYLKCNTETSINRIKNRGLISEINGYNMDYITKLKDMYDDVISSTTNVKIVSLNWDKSIILNDNMISEDSLINIINLL